MAYALGPEGWQLLKQDEELRLAAYDDATGVTVEADGRHAGKLTIGWGHTGPDVCAGKRITQREAEALLEQDVAERLPAVNKLIRAQVSQHQFDAMFVFAFNVGVSRLAASRLLYRTNARDFSGAAEEFARWNLSGGHLSRGLMKRRADEAALFRRGDKENLVMA